MIWFEGIRIAEILLRVGVDALLCSLTGSKVGDFDLDPLGLLSM